MVYVVVVVFLWTLQYSQLTPCKVLIMTADMLESVKHTAVFASWGIAPYEHTPFPLAIPPTARLSVSVCSYFCICPVFLHQTFYSSLHYDGASAATGADRHFGDQ